MHARQNKQQTSSNMLLWLVAIGFFMQALDATIVNTALPAMARSLGESPLRMQSVVIAYALAMAMLIPASGWIADRFGTRHVYLAALLLFSAGSLLCAYSPSLHYLTAARAIQGIGGSMLLPVGRLAVLRAFPREQFLREQFLREQFLRAMSFVTIPGLVSPLLGPTLGGWLVEYAWWHWIFLINIPVGLISLAAYWLRAVRQPAPLFPLALFKVNSFSVGVIGNLFSRIGSGSMPFLIPLLLQVSLGYSAFDAGLMMIPVAAAGILIKQVATPLIRRTGYRKLLIVNTVIVGLTIASFALFSANEPAWLRILHLALFGAANSMQFTAMNTLTLKDLDSRLASSGNSLLSMIMMLSMSLGVAAAGGLLATFSALLGQDAGGGKTLSAFHASFLCMGLITAASAWIFWQLSSDAVTDSKPAGSIETEFD